MPVRNRRRTTCAFEVTVPLAFLVILPFERARFLRRGLGEVGRLRLTEAEVVVARYRLTVRPPWRPPRSWQARRSRRSAGPGTGGVRPNYWLRLERGPPAGGAALQDELFEKSVRLFHLTVA